MKCICKWHKPECDCGFTPEEGESDSFVMMSWVVPTTLILAIIIILMVIFLSSGRAEASHGKPGYVISDCCSGVNPRSGTSYRLVALAFQPYRYTSVFETGTCDIEYILQWPKLESTTEQYIRLARQRLAVVMAVEAAPKVVRKYAGVSLKSQQTWRAIGMACLFGGIMLFAVASTSGRDRANK